MREWNDKPEVPNCLRCGEPLTLERCGEEFVETGICSECWTPEDDEREAVDCFGNLPEAGDAWYALLR